MPQDLSAPPTMIGSEIPLIDVSGFLAGRPDAAKRAAAELRFAFEKVGFYYLGGHGVPQALIDATYAAAARFHAQPLEAKLAVKVDEHNIGYMPIARKPPPNAAAQGKKPSQNEAYFLRRERSPDDPDVVSNRRFHAMNKWPVDLPGFRETTLAYMGALEALCRRLVPLYALALDLPATFFDACFARPHMILRMSRYPLIDAADESTASLVPHTDSGFMTLLPPNKVQGLSILLPDGRWMDAPHVEDAFVVNGGDILPPLDQRAVPVDAASRAQPLGPGPLRHPLLLRSRPRHRDRMPANLSLRGAAGEIPTDQVRRLCALVRHAALRAPAERGGADRRRDRARRAGHRSMVIGRW